MHNKKQMKYKTALWTATKDPLYWVDCPHCGKTIFMGKPSFIERLIKWAKNLKKVK